MTGTPTRTNPFANIDDKLDDFTPKQPPAASKPASLPTGRTSRAEQKAIVSELAQKEGFIINNFEETPLPAKRRPAQPKTILKTVRIQVSDWNKFQLWCNNKGYSHKEGFQILAQLIPADQNTGREGN
jgi:hypothetical protein